uniref:ribosomal protein L13 n=1 Tax=Hypnea brasiliensis TaxID=1866962 RepID=UPI0023F446AF|nr:ribosomal protein L13 [Hypnea brasiliensis]WCH55388.1 ribosomal protein L13 [Hypnea brasiliensis]WDY84821.1 ribosomal protein L13 [Hypnea brasiliensis]
MNHTYLQNTLSKQKWYLIDAKNQRLGRLSTCIARLLKGKNEITYTPHINSKIYIIVINAQDIVVTGQKKYNKKYIRHSGKPGSLKIENFTSLNKRIPTRIIEHAIKGMLPKNKLGRQIFRQINVYKSEQHPHTGQKPQTITINL